MRGRRVADRARSVADARLARVARQWLPPEETGPPSGTVDLRVPTRLRWGPWPPSAVRALALLLAGAALLAGYAAWHSRPRAVAAPVVLATGVPVTGLASPAPPRSATPAPAPSPVATPVASASADVVVHVAGMVVRPGLVRLPAGSRVADAVTAAGGVTRRKAADSVNLARVLVDGEQIVVTDAPAAGQPGVGPSGAPGTPLVLDLNTATAADLDALPGLGPVLAARIIAWRTEHGPFRSVEELGEVSGIGEAILSQIRSVVRV